MNKFPKLYFDESGDLGNIKNSQTDFFTICIYKEINPEVSSNFIEAIKKKTKTARTELKWYRLDKEKRKAFSDLSKDMNEYVYIIICDKNKSEIFGENLFKDMMSKLIINYNLQGKFYYDADHLTKTLHEVHSSLKLKNYKINFINSKTISNQGIQIADLYAGYARDTSSKNGNFNLKNVLYYK